MQMVSFMPVKKEWKQQRGNNPAIARSNNMKNGKFGTLGQLAREIERQHEVKRDIVGNTGHIEVHHNTISNDFQMSSFAKVRDSQ